MCISIFIGNILFRTLHSIPMYQKITFNTSHAKIQKEITLQAISRQIPRKYEIRTIMNYFRDCRLMFSIWPSQPTGPIRFCFRAIKFPFLYLIPVVSAGFFVNSQWQRHSSPLKAHFYVHVFVSGNLKLCSLLYPVCQLHHVCRVWMPKKMYRISVSFVRALTRLRS